MRQYRTALKLAALVAVLLSSTVVVLADDLVNDLAVKYGPGFWHESPHKRFGLTWTSGPWKHTQEFRDAKEEVEREFNARLSDPDVIVLKYRSRAVENRQSALALFHWAHAMLLAGGRASAKGEDYWHTYDRIRDVGALDWLMAKSEQKQDIEYVKARYLFACLLRYREELLPLGRALVKAEPRDDAIQRTLARELSRSRDPLKLSQAIGLGDDLVRRDPRSPKNASLMGSIYLTRWLSQGKRREDGESAIKWLQKYVDLAPKGCENSRTYMHLIALISKDLRKGN